MSALIKDLHPNLPSNGQRDYRTFSLLGDDYLLAGPVGVRVAIALLPRPFSFQKVSVPLLFTKSFPGGGSLCLDRASVPHRFSSWSSDTTTESTSRSAVSLLTRKIFEKNHIGFGWRDERHKFEILNLLSHLKKRYIKLGQSSPNQTSSRKCVASAM